MKPEDLLSRFETFVAQQRLFTKADRLLLAVSGGIDSVVLVHLCQAAGFDIAIAHCNFGLRGAESDRDEGFVKALANSYNLPFFVQRFETSAFAQAHKLSIQVAARELRYQWFATLLSPGVDPTTGNGSFQPFHYLLTGHHVDDNIETVAMHFFKGTGMAGLRGMLPKQGRIVRPLLFARRTALEEYAATHHLQWVTDSSNDETKYTRNFFRHEVLPMIEAKIPGALNNLAHNLPRFADAALLYDQAVAHHLEKLVVKNGNSVQVPVLRLLKSEPVSTILFEIVRPYGFTPGQLPDLLHLLHAETGRFVRSGTHQTIRHRRWLVIAPLQPEGQSLLVIEQKETAVWYDGGMLRLDAIKPPRELATSQDTALLNATALSYPLVLRRWRSGDYFYPLGLGKKKKVARLLVDCKLSKAEKEEVWVLESGKKIAWVVGLRIDDRFKVTQSTQAVVKVTSVPAPAASTAPR